jgi:plasmid stabilization system protein ParE
MSLPRYKVLISPEAMDDIDRVYSHIAFEVFQPESARAYRRGIYRLIRRISQFGGILAVSLNSRLRRRYGSAVRTVKYRKMTIIYTVADDFVIVHRVIAGQLII